MNTSFPMPNQKRMTAAGQTWLRRQKLSRGAWVGVFALSAIIGSPLRVVGQVATVAQTSADETAALAKAREGRLRSYGHRTANSPTVVHVSLVAPDVLSITIEAQRVVQ